MKEITISMPFLLVECNESVPGLVDQQTPIQQDLSAYLWFPVQCFHLAQNYRSRRYNSMQTIKQLVTTISYGNRWLGMMHRQGANQIQIDGDNIPNLHMSMRKLSEASRQSW